MDAHLNNHQLNIYLLYAQDVISHPNGNHKSKIGNRYAKKKEKGIKQLTQKRHRTTREESKTGKEQRNKIQP